MLLFIISFSGETSSCYFLLDYFCLCKRHHMFHLKIFVGFAYYTATIFAKMLYV